MPITETKKKSHAAVDIIAEVTKIVKEITMEEERRD